MTRTAHDWRDIELETGECFDPVTVEERGTMLSIGRDREDWGSALTLWSREEVDALIATLQALAPRMLTREQVSQRYAIHRCGERPPEPPREPEPPCMVTIIHKDGSREEVDADEAFGAGTYQAMYAHAAQYPLINGGELTIGNPTDYLQPDGKLRISAPSYDYELSPQSAGITFDPPAEVNYGDTPTISFEKPEVAAALARMKQIEEACAAGVRQASVDWLREDREPTIAEKLDRVEEEGNEDE